MPSRCRQRAFSRIMSAMPLTVVRGKKIEMLDPARLAVVLAPHGGRVSVDLGAGDGAWAYRYAAAHPERFVIAIDPVRENMREFSARAAKKPERGGLANVLYAVASIEQLPSELCGLADEVFVTLPWGSLMRGIILADEVVLRGIASLARGDAALRIVLNTRIFDDPVPIDVRDLPEVTPDYVRDALCVPYGECGIEITQTRWMDADEVAAIGTTWAKRLSHRAPPRSVLIQARVVASTEDRNTSIEQP